MITIAPTTRRPTHGSKAVPFQVCSASSSATEATAAVRELGAAIPSRPDVLIVFVSPSYDLHQLGPMLQMAFEDTLVVGCTSSGVLSKLGYQAAGMSAIALHGTLEVSQFLIEPLDQLHANMESLTKSMAAFASDSVAEGHTFGFLMADGLSMAEERLISALHAALPDTPIVGGSAGDDLAFSETHVLHSGQFRSNSAVLLRVTLPVPFETLDLAHHRPTDTKMVITEAVPEERLVTQINGRPAADVYAEIVGVPIRELGPEIFSRHPVMLRIQDSHYIRSIRAIEPNGIRFACAIEKGLVLRLAEPVRVMEALEEAFGELERDFGKPDVVIGCDCIFRRLELETLGLADEVGRFLAGKHVAGFSTYGEQVRGVHVNQTFVGLALRGER